MAPPPLPTPPPTPTLVLAERQAVITTVSVTAADSATAAASTKTSIPIAPIVGGLVGGILGGLLIAGIVYWCYVKKNKERDARHRAAVSRRNRKRQAAIQAQEAKAKAQTAKQVFDKSNNEKYASHAAAAAAALPVLPKAAYNPNSPDSGYGYSSSPSSSETPDYAAQYLAAVEEPDHDEPVYETQQSYEHQPELAPVLSTSNSSDKSKPSRSKARMAVAESAVANASADPNSRYRPNKPSPLAAAKAEEQRLANLRNGGGNGYNNADVYNSNYQETLAVPGAAYYGQPDQSNSARATSGEWGVALGSPTGDGSFAQQQQQQHESPFHYDQNDPYLPANDAHRYHDSDRDMDYHEAAASVGMGSTKKGGNWV